MGAPVSRGRTEKGYTAMKKILAAATATVAILSMAACSSGGAQSGSAQTVDEACTTILASLDELSAEFADKTGESAEELGEMSIATKNHLNELDKKITNAEVREVWMPVSELQVKVMEAAAAEDQEAIMTAYTELSEKTPAFAEVCAPEAAQS